MTLGLYKRNNSTIKQYYYIAEDGVEYEKMSTKEVNTLLKHNGISPCYFGKCSKNLDAGIEELNSYNVDEINGLYLRFLEINYLTFVDIFDLEDEAIDHIIYHFMEYLNLLKTTILSRKVICRRLLNKDIDRNKKKTKSTYSNQIF